MKRSVSEGTIEHTGVTTSESVQREEECVAVQQMTHSAILILEYACMFNVITDNSVLEQNWQMHS